MCLNNTFREGTCLWWEKKEKKKWMKGKVQQCDKAKLEQSKSVIIFYADDSMTNYKI